LTCRSRVAQPGAPDAEGGATACADDPDEGCPDEAGADGADDAAADEAAGAAAPDTDVVADDTGGGGEDELPTAHPASTAPAAATPATLSNNETEPVITNHPF
jgi:hypothetical protein